MFLFTGKEKSSGKGKVERENMIIKACLFYLSKSTIETLRSHSYSASTWQKVLIRKMRPEIDKGVKEGATNLCTRW